MSASPSALLAPPAMPTMVSRLPKFGFRPSSSGVPQASNPQSVPTATASGGTPMGGVDLSAPLTNGSNHQPPNTVSTAVTGGLVKNNGLLGMPAPLSISWTKRGKVGVNRAGVPGRKIGAVAQSDVVTPCQQLQLPPAQQQPSPSTTQRWLKKPNPPVTTAPTTVASKVRVFGLGAASASSPPLGPKLLPAVKGGAGGTRPGQKAVPGLTNGTRPNLNGPAQRFGALRQRASSSGSGGPGGSRPSSRSGSPLLSKQPAGRSQSSDSLRTGGLGGGGPSVRLLSEKDRLRSRSLNQVQRQPWSTLPAALSAAPASSRITRSYSLNRAAERGSKEPPPTAPSSRLLLLPKAPGGRSPLAKHAPWGDADGVVGLGGAKGLLPVSHLKKPLLPSTHLSYNALGAHRSRPSLIRQPRPLRVTPAPGAQHHSQEVEVQGAEARRNSLESPSVTPSTTENSPGSTPEAVERVSHGEVSLLGETLEDMSLSSTSSLERHNDTSQEYMDDFDNLGNGGVGILLLSTNDGGEEMAMNQSESRTHDVKVLRSSDETRMSGMPSFLGDSIDWSGVRLSGDPEDYHLSRLTRQRRTSQQDYQEQGGSSLDLSPSDSCGSGGTYMWDEEGLEPLGGAVTSATTITANTASTAHHRGSYDSDLNSIDLLNNLDSCDLDDDDLMLDDELPEDPLLHGDGDGITHMAQWRMPQLCWGTQDIHNDNSEFQSYHLTEDPGNQRSDKELLLGLSTARSAGTSTGLSLSLNRDLDLDLSLGMDLGLGMDVEELADNCSAVRAQLEHLQRLLLQEGGGEEEDLEDTLTTDTLSPEDSNSSEEQPLNKQVAELFCEVQQLREDVRRRDQTIAQLTQQLTVPVATSRCHCRETGTERRTAGQTQTTVADGGRAWLHQASQTPWREHNGSPPVPFLSPPWQYQRSRPYRGRQRPCVPHCGPQTSGTTVPYPAGPSGPTDPDSPRPGPPGAPPR
ncbi:serine-rich coiled-coil domain-containing protein 2 isoform X2 [Gadus morhua]|uniref:serine-rich coiled-coil domain-containing protein 2 isoform X2 n=1 Tax=Gadus morhua TaxID=8049 RepID=UPI0011B71704|nr:serine-rich coiled-coil domain-containing protein 2-like isoform X2 [Gadus morhua]